MAKAGLEVKLGQTWSQHGPSMALALTLGSLDLQPEENEETCAQVQTWHG